MNILARILLLFVALALLIALFSIGFIVIAIAAGVISLSALAYYIRMKLSGAITPPPPFSSGEVENHPDPMVIEGEFKDITDDETPVSR